MDVARWLGKLGLGEYAQTFAENHVDAETLPRLTAEDLKDIGVTSVGHRRKLLEAIAVLAEGDQEAPPQDAVEAEPAPSGEFRQVTVLFADLAGFTRLSGELGAEETHSLLNRYFEAVDGIVTGYGGHVDKHMGDNVMAVFGAPTAHSNDPQRAVRAALEIHKVMASLSEEFRRPLTAHVGVASGQVVASGTGSETHREYTVTGTSVNLASRLQDKAKAGETLVSHEVQAAVSNLIDCSLMGEIEVKGFQEPVQAWLLDGIRSDRSLARRGPFVGRSSEKRHFVGVLEECREKGLGQTILIRGEAGIGKTRLVEEFTAIAEGESFRVYRGLVLDFGVGKGQDAVRSLVRSFLGLVTLGGEAERAKAADQAMEMKWLEPDQRVFLNDLLDLPQPTALRSLYDAMDNETRNRGKQAVVAKLVQSVSAERANLITVEDIHWADPLTLGHLASIASVVADCPAVLVMTTRVEGDPLDQAWQASLRGSPVLTVDLRPLREAEAKELASGFVQATGDLLAACLERAEGNPLFLEQLLHNAEEGALTEVPGSIQSLVLARMDRVPPQDKRALQAAAVIGQRFALDVLRHLLDDGSYECTALVENHLLRPEGTDYLFAHALIREGVYTSLLQTQKRELHHRAASWFAGQDPVLCAEHLDRADDEGAARAYLDAARGQASSYHYERALRLAERGMELARSAADHFALTCFRGELLHDSGEVADSMEAYRQAVQLAQSDSERVSAWIGLVAGMRMTDRYDEGLDILDSAEQAASGLGLDTELARIHHLRGNLYFPLGRIEDCKKQHELALEFARRAHSLEDEARALGGLGDAYYAQGRMRTAHEHFQRCVGLCRDHGFGRIEVANLSMAAITRVYFDPLHVVADAANAAIEAATKVAHERAEVIAQNCALLALTDLGDLHRAKGHLARLEVLVRHLGARRFEVTGSVYRARIALMEDKRTGVLGLLRNAMKVSRDTGVGFAGPRVLGTLAMATRDPEEREQALKDGEALLRAGAVGHNHFLFYRDAVEASLGAGDWDGAERYAAALEDYTRSEPLPWTDFFMARGRALAAFGRGDRDEATTVALERLRDEAERLGLVSALPAIEKALVTA